MVLRGFTAIAACVCACGCVESQLEANMNASSMNMSASRCDALPTIQTRAALVPPVDTFWIQESVAEATQPPPERARSISLGYVGDTPLTGGVMRDTPMEAISPGISAQNYMQYAPTYPECVSCMMMGSGGRVRGGRSHARSR